MSATDSALIDELHRKLGRNLLRFQEIEFSLKFVMPYIHPEGSAMGADGVKAVRERIARKSLGEMMREFTDSIDSPTPELVARELKKVVDARNRLVHQFFELPGVDFMTLDGVREAIRYLDRQVEETRPIYEMVRGLSAAGLFAILDTPELQNSEFAQYREALIKRLSPNTEIINLGDPPRTQWQTTRIVQLLKQAEAETERVCGLTLLSRAGHFIRQREPDLRPSDYGLAKLWQVLVVCGLFEVFELRRSDGTGAMIAYRSRRGENDEAAPQLLD